jgi:hypothetical protein
MLYLQPKDTPPRRVYKVVRAQGHLHRCQIDRQSKRSQRSRPPFQYRDLVWVVSSAILARLERIQTTPLRIAGEKDLFVTARLARLPISKTVVLIEALVENGGGCEASRGSVIWEGTAAWGRTPRISGSQIKIDDSSIV